jgi:hypothetical protein
MPSIYDFARILIAKPVPTFAEYALARKSRFYRRSAAIGHH